MAKILQRYINLPRPEGQLYGLDARKAVSKHLGPVAQDKADCVKTADSRSRYDISDIRLDRPSEYYFSCPNSRKQRDSVTEGNNIIDNEEDNPLNKGITVTTMKVKVTGYLPDGSAIKAFSDIWNDNGYAGSDALDCNGTGDCFFFHASTNFLMDAAKKYAAISDKQDFKYRPTKDGDFVRSAVEFFKGSPATEEEVQSVQKQMDNVIKELADRIKTGGSTDINTLKSTITIEGTDMTIGNLVNTQKSLSGFENTMKLANDSYGTNDLGQFGKLGMLKPLIHVYAQNFSKNLRNGVEKAFNSAADNIYKKAVDKQEEWHAKTVGEEGKSSRKDTYYSSNAYYGTLREDIYNIFSELDTSSTDAMKADFENGVKKSSDLTQVLDNETGTDETSWYIGNIRNLFNTALQQSNEKNK